ncbi:MAG: helix-turn-helix domain-containing protein [Planctomycetes bacterium]|nr:helix-turn-helix domain-containing protein [Planctomycetota bacterium]
MTNQKWISTEEAADALHLSAQTIATWIRSRHIKAAKVGRRWLIPQAEIERLVRLHAHRPALGPKKTKS